MLLGCVWWLIDWLEVAYKAKFDICGNSVLSGASKHMRNRSLEPRWPWERVCPGIWRKVCRECRCFGLLLGIRQELKLILPTTHGARIPWPTSGLHIYDYNIDGCPWVQILTTQHLLLVNCSEGRSKRLLSKDNDMFTFHLERKPWKKSNG